MKNNTWQLQDAKSKFSQLVENAMSNEPQFVTKHGNNAVVVPCELYWINISGNGIMLLFPKKSFRS